MEKTGIPPRWESTARLGLGAIADLAVFFLLSWLGWEQRLSQLCAYAAGAVLYRSFLASPATERPGRSWSILAALLVLYCVRSGVWASSEILMPGSPSLSYGLGLAATCLALGLSREAVQALSGGTKQLTTADTAFFLAGSAFLLKLVWSGAFELLPHESYYWNYAQHLALGYLDHPPMVAWLIAAGTALCGTNEFGVRVLAALAGLICLGFIFALANRLYGRGAAYGAVSIFACPPYFFYSGLVVSPDSILMAAWAAALYFVQRAIQGAGAWHWVAFGAAVGIGLLSKYSIILVPFSLLLFLLCYPRYRRWLLSPYPYLSAVVALTIFSPVIYWNAVNDWASFAFQTSRRAEASFEFALHHTLIDVMYLITPIGLWALLSEAGRWRRERKEAGAPLEADRFVAVFTLVPFAVFALYSLLHTPKLNWTGPCFLACLPLFGAQISAWRPGERGRAYDLALRCWAGVCLLLLVSFGLVFHYFALGLPGIPYPRGMSRFLGWDTLGVKVQQAALDLKQTTGKIPVIVGMDKHVITSQLSFYVPDRGGSAKFEFGGSDIFGKESLMWRNWGEKELLGKPFILVARIRADLELAGLQNYFESLEPIHKYQAYTNGQKSSSFYLRVGYGFRTP